MYTKLLDYKKSFKKYAVVKWINNKCTHEDRKEKIRCNEDVPSPAKLVRGL
jgi:hypothetical protein